MYVPADAFSFIPCITLKGGSFIWNTLGLGNCGDICCHKQSLVSLCHSNRTLLRAILVFAKSSFTQKSCNLIPADINYIS